jgi:tRNA(Arg) A34 adenosine deaminase TadA
MNDNDDSLLRETIRLSREHMLAGEGGPFGAIIARDGEILSRGWNRVTSTNDPTAHAEIVAIRAACARLGTFTLDGCVLYSSCEPCPMCLTAAYWARISRIVFAASRHDAAGAGFDDEWLYRELPLAIEARRVPTRQTLREEAQRVFAEWLQFPGRIVY